MLIRLWGASFAAAVVSLVAAMPSAAAESACVVPRQLGVVFVLDDSGSMNSNDPDNLRGTAAGIGLDQLADGSVAAASKFSSTATTIFAPTRLSGSRDTLKTRVDDALLSSGGTIYEQAFKDAKRQLDAMPATVDKKAVVFLSDGAPNDTNFMADLHRRLRRRRRRSARRRRRTLRRAGLRRHFQR